MQLLESDHMNNLVIVESPTKARTLSRFLGNRYQIEASMGHVRDLPKSELGVDVEHNFEPNYIIPRDKKKQVNQLKKVAQNAQTIWLATDPDREGEAIAWHIKELIADRKSNIGKDKTDTRVTTDDVHRVVFHEITEGAIKDAFAHPRALDLHLVDAQQARRVLDRLVGYKLSPLLWRKVKRGLSAGRVQTVALRLVVEREREIEKFKPVEYWSIEAELQAIAQGLVGARGPVGSQPHSTSSLDAAGAQRDAPLTATPRSNTFIATLIELNGKKLEIKNESQAKEHVTNLEKAAYQVNKITQRQLKRSPAPPFTTSTLQQTAGNKLGFTAKKTMMLAQNLYEHGLITYMRTDSVNLAPIALTAARELIKTEFGERFLPSKPRFYKARSKNVQEAHEAIRPTEIRRQSSDIRNQNGITKDHARLYELVWKRMVASQMSDALIDQTTVDVVAGPASSFYTLRATGSQVKFEGWLKIYGVSQLDEEEEVGKQVLPHLDEGQSLALLQLLKKQHFTESPSRFSEASLIKKLEELGIGRPSTYAPILSTIQERLYVERVERRFIPTSLGMAVTDFLIKYFPDVFDYAFTAQMEDQLDEISRGERNWRETIGQFFTPFEKKLEGTIETAQRVKIKVEVTDQICPECGKPLVVRTGRFGKFLACSGFPECKYTQSLEEKVSIPCSDCGGQLVMKKTRRGKSFYGCQNWPTCKFASWTKPKTPA